MNLSSTEGSISTLLSKLCLHFAKNDVGKYNNTTALKFICYYVKTIPDLSTNLYKLVMHFLTSASSTNIASSTDEQFVVAQIRKHLLSTQSAETLEKFDVLYASFQKSVRNLDFILKYLEYNSFVTDSTKTQMFNINVFVEYEQWNITEAVNQLEYIARFTERTRQSSICQVTTCSCA